MNWKELKWKELKDFVNNLDEEQLKYDVVIIGEEESFKIKFAECLNEDHVNFEDLSMEPISAYKNDENWQEEYPGLEDSIVAKKGHPFLYINF